jgi:glycosyltransferase involved in cell wall biosynthesis
LDFSIIIPTKNRDKILEQTLAFAIKSTQNFTVEFLIINDGEKEIQLAEDIKSKITIYKNPKSGVAAARNFGASKSASDFLIFMDDDMWMQSDNLSALQPIIAAYSGCCINLNWIYPPALTEQIKQTQFGRYLEHYGFSSLKGWCKGLPWNDNDLFEVNGITSQFLYMHKSVWKSVNGYNENFPHAGFEDHDFAERLKKKGTKFYIYPKSMVFHNEADRVEPKSWLARKMRGGETRKYAVEAGYKSLTLQYNFIKTLIYKLCIAIKPFLFFCLMIIPNIRIFDKLYFSLINLLLGAHSFEGYTKK